MKTLTLRRFWPRPGPATRLAGGLVALMVSTLILSEFFVTGFLPNPADEARRSRPLISRLAASQVLEPLRLGDYDEVRNILSGLLRQTPELQSMTLVANGQEPIVIGDHARHWRLADEAPSTIDQIRVTLLSSGQPHGALQLAFKPVLPTSPLAMLLHPTVLGLLVMALLGFIGFQLYLRRAMRYLDPAAAVPDRVRSAFDTLIEGVLVIDRGGNVMLANAALSRIRADAGPGLIGQPIDQLEWLSADFVAKGRTPPWRKVLAGKGASLGRQIQIDSGDGQIRTVVLNCSPVDNGQDRVQGCLLTLSDITELEERTRKLRTALDDLSASQAEIVAKNAELTWLAMRDPLTGAFNRRTLMAEADLHFSRSRTAGDPMVCLMCDIDHFKSINDRFGHAAGDRVIQAVARELDRSVGERGIVGRYGGEEFCVILTGQTLTQGLRLAEYARNAVSEQATAALGEPSRGPVTMSLGVAVLEPAVKSSAELIDRADQALYQAKHGGRNRVVGWSPSTGEGPSAERPAKGLGQAGDDDAARAFADAVPGNADGEDAVHAAGTSGDDGRAAP